MKKYIQRFKIETGLTLTWESTESETNVRAVDQNGNCVGYRTFGIKQLKNKLLVDTAMSDFIAQTKLRCGSVDLGLAAPLPDAETLKAVLTHPHPDAAGSAPDQ